MKHDAKAIGSGSEAAQAELQDQYTKVRLVSFRVSPPLFSLSLPLQSIATSPPSLSRALC